MIGNSPLVSSSVSSSLPLSVVRAHILFILLMHLTERIIVETEGQVFSDG